MYIAKVVGKVIAPQKVTSLQGSKLLLIQSIDANRKIINEKEYLVAIDLVGAGDNDCVLVEWGSQLSHDDNLRGDLHIVGIIESIQ